MHRGEIYLVDLSDRKWSEQQGVRPAIVVQNDVGNAYSPTTIVCPITSKSKRLAATHVSISPDDSGVICESTVLCEQIITIDKMRIKRKLGEVISMNKLSEIEEKMSVAIGIRSGR